jgi:hypothetical protein
VASSRATIAATISSSQTRLEKLRALRFFDCRGLRDGRAQFLVGVNDPRHRAGLVTEFATDLIDQVRKLGVHDDHSRCEEQERAPEGISSQLCAQRRNDSPP